MGVQTLSVAEFKTWRDDNKDCVLLDVREDG